MFSVSQVTLRLGVCSKTIKRWDKIGHIKCLGTPSGHRRISLSEVNRLLGMLHRELIEDPSRKRCAVYVRVSAIVRRLMVILEDNSRSVVTKSHSSLLKLYLDIVSDLLYDILINIVLRELVMYFFFNYCIFDSS